MQMLDGEAREVIAFGAQAKLAVENVRTFIGDKPSTHLGPRRKKQLLRLLENIEDSITELEEYLGV